MIKHATGRHYYTVLYTSSNHSTSLVEVSDVASCCSQPLIIDLWGTPMEKMWKATWGYTTFRPSPVFNSGLMLWTQFSLAGHLAVVGAHELYSTTCAPGGKCRAWTPKHPKTMCPGVLRDPFSQISKFPIFMGTPNALDPETRVSCGEC